MKQILVTGAGGFIGSHLTEELLNAGYSVTAFVHYNSQNSLGWLDNIPKADGVNVVTGDVRDLDSVTRSMKGMDAVFHLAALVGIPYSYESPLAYLRTNIEGTYNVLQAAREHKVGNIIITSTSETYGTAQYVPIDENHPAVGQSPYAATKIAADQLAVSFHKSFDLPVKIVRPFNTYGPRQSLRAIIPTVVGQILSGHKVIKLGNVHPTRDLTYVKDTVRGFIEIAKHDALNGQAVNIGMKNEISIGDLAVLIGKLMKVDVEIQTDSKRTRPDSSEVERLHCENKKILETTKWRPEFSLEEGLEQTIDWIRSNMELGKAQDYNV